MGSVATLGAAALPAIRLGQCTETDTNLVPTTPAVSPSYWCTWSAQNYMYGRGAKDLDVKVLEGNSGNQIAHDQINEEMLLGSAGWAKRFFPSIRTDLYLLLDDGWAESGSATFLLDEKKFPSFKGTPPERLRKLNDAIRAQGWRGLALWCRDTPGGKDDERFVQWSKEAGVHYWKIDGGDGSFNVIRARNQEHASLTVEHIHGEPPLNGDWSRDGRFGEQIWRSPRIEILRQTDVYRTYDTTPILSIPTTLDRVSEMLRGSAGHDDVRGILNVEDEVYIAAVLGCTMGVMRHPLRGERPGADVDLCFSGPRQLKRRMDEVVRAIRWQRLAAPFPAGLGFVRLDNHVLTDDWFFHRGETWDTDAISHRAMQAAPARISRNLELPDVDCRGARPFIFTASFPNGAAAIGAHERISTDRGWTTPKAQVRWKLTEPAGPFGLFGRFNSVRLAFRKPVGKIRVWAQDLAGDRAHEITRSVHIDGSEIFLPGHLLEEVGLDAATAGDLSAPALVLNVDEI